MMSSDDQAGGFGNRGSPNQAGMNAPSADGSADQKREWFAHVYQRYVESYRQQGNDEPTAKNMAQRSLEQ